jgi:exonuclease SbcC
VRVLQKIQLENFRQYAGRVSVDLDGDFVLVYAPNGYGKTSLLSAIELAVTGDVQDLKKYSSDYPACLNHQPASGDASVRLTLSPSGRESVTAAVSVGRGGIRADASVSSEWAERFNQRSYLSQERLRWLLEPGDKGGPLARVLQKMLGLDLAENLSEGLRAAANIGTLRGKSSDLQSLFDEIGHLREELSEADAAVESLVQRKAEVLAVMTETVGDAVPSPESVQARLSAEVDDVTQWSVALSRLRELRRALQAGSRAAEERSLIETEVEDAKVQVRELETTFSTASADLEERARALGLEDEAWSGLSGWARADVLREQVAATTQRLAASVQRIAELAEVIDGTSMNLDSLRQSLAETQSRLQGSAAAGALEVIDALQAAKAAVSSEVCPVCGRDFSEVSPIPLEAHIETALERLTQSVEMSDTLFAQERSLREALEVASATLGKAIADRDREAALLGTDARDRLRSLSELLDEAEPHAVEALALRKSRERLNELRATVGGLDDAAANAAAAKGEAERILNSLEVEATQDLSDSGFWDAVEGDIQKRIARKKALIDGYQSLSQQIATLSMLEAQLTAAAQIRPELTGKLNEAESRLTGVKAIQAEANAIVTAAENAKKAAIDQAVTEGVNSLWAEIFSRLVVGERFLPEIAEPRVFRRQLQLQIHAALRDDSSCAMNPGAVFSSGNLNTCALSLFLALNALESSHSGLVMLDDPVQSMDEIHVANFAALLRTLGRDLSRQVLVAVHERSLFDFLRLELAPASPAESMLLIELKRGREDSPLPFVQRVDWLGNMLAAV